MAGRAGRGARAGLRWAGHGTRPGLGWPLYAGDGGRAPVHLVLPVRNLERCHLPTIIRVPLLHRIPRRPVAEPSPQGQSRTTSDCRSLRCGGRPSPSPVRRTANTSPRCTCGRYRRTLGRLIEMRDQQPAWCSVTAPTPHPTGKSRTCVHPRDPQCRQVALSRHLSTLPGRETPRELSASVGGPPLLAEVTCGRHCLARSQPGSNHSFIQGFIRE